jgi:transposase, IS30 family
MGPFTQLSYNDRSQIYRGLKDGRSRKEIAIMIGRPTSTVSREIKRNSDRYGYCYPNEAHIKAQDRRNKNEHKIIKNHVLRAYIIGKLKSRWSPSTIANAWNVQKKDMTISKETIYQWIYSEKTQALKLNKLLVRSRKKRGTKRQQPKGKIKNRVSIHDRPDNINQRIEPGHYECDLIFNSGSQSKNVCVLIERVSRKAFLFRNKNKSTKTVLGAVIKRIKDDEISVSSITFDNGSEFADHHRLNEMGISTYFCDPGTPSQKGSVENYNGILRRYLPFERFADDITDEHVAEAERLLDLMPREILSNKTPLDVFVQHYPETKLNESRVKPASPAAEANLFY